ncbi:hypothetical protein GHT06_013769 [Daphnia sinensis]|uniref:Transmembrane protein n=1 Tax=Daphnia sinensis TaxID=1820382 RepID=A0AAD5LCL7_9CRUS|nr:hypothetical protein GHT06_013769 [Daphnia sinensis]
MAVGFPTQDVCCSYGCLLLLGSCCGVWTGLTLVLVCTFHLRWLLWRNDSDSVCGGHESNFLNSVWVCCDVKYATVVRQWLLGPYSSFLCSGGVIVGAASW